MAILASFGLLLMIISCSVIGPAASRVCPKAEVFADSMHSAYVPPLLPTNGSITTAPNFDTLCERYSYYDCKICPLKIMWPRWSNEKKWKKIVTCSEKYFMRHLFVGHNNESWDTVVLRPRPSYTGARLLLETSTEVVEHVLAAACWRSDLSRRGLWEQRKKRSKLPECASIFFSFLVFFQVQTGSKHHFCTRRVV